MPTSPLIVGSSNIGRLRARNEDTLALLPDFGVACVADGMGGVPGGDVASRIAARTIEDVLRNRLPAAEAGSAADVLASSLEAALEAAHLAVRRAGDADPALTDMGTTLTVLATPAGTGVWALGHVGDSRAYQWRDGSLVQLSRDQTWVQEMVEEGRLSGLQADRHPYRHILSQCIGSPEAPRPQFEAGLARPGDLYMLCTDGLTGMVDDESLAALLDEHVAADADAEALAAAADVLVDAANERGGEDNITVALVRIQDPQ